MERRSYSVMAVCNPLLDHLNHVSEEFLEGIGVKPGTMSLVDEARFQGIADQLGPGYIMPGGSSANTLRGVAWLAKSRPVPPPVYFGAVGGDAAGRDYTRLLASSGVKVRLAGKNTRTGASIVVITPDSQRTMFTFLGASQEIGVSDVDFSVIGEASVFYCAGYMWDSPAGREIINMAAGRAHQEKTIFAFDIADPFVVNRYRDDFLSWIPLHVNILFGNRDEFGILTGLQKKDEELCRAAAEYADIVVMKAGAGGAWIAADGDIIHAPGKKAKVIDTTGAGDSFAAGFLHGLLSGRGMKECGDQGNSLAAAIVEKDGCDFDGISGLK